MDVRGNQDTYWSQSDRELIRQCQGLMKASGACLRKLSSAVRNNGRVETEENIAQLDDLADVAKDVSPGWVCLLKEGCVGGTHPSCLLKESTGNDGLFCVCL